MTSTSSALVVLLGGLFGLAAGCTVGEDVAPPARGVHGLVGGTSAPTTFTLSEGQRRAIGRLETADGRLRCTGALVGPRQLVTAGHCVPAESVGGPGALPEQLQFRASGTPPVPVVAVVRHPTADLAIAVLGALPPGGEPLAVRDPALPVLVGQTVEVAGAGRGTASELSFGVFTVSAVDARSFELTSAADAGLCPGDSGGPVFFGEPALGGVHLSGFDSCFGPSRELRLDGLAGWWAGALQTEAPWSAPCAVTGGSRCEATELLECRDGWWRVTPCTRLVGHRCVAADAGASCAATPCGDVTPAGGCADGVARSCQFGALVEDDCAATGRACGFDAVGGRAACVACPEGQWCGRGARGPLDERVASLPAEARGCSVSGGLGALAAVLLLARRGRR